jgi:phosphoribosylformylglycinamidine (FGAM) synthase PurS component
MTDLGENQIISLSMGKWFELEVEDDYDIERICKLLLSNSVIENYNIMKIE